MKSSLCGSNIGIRVWNEWLHIGIERCVSNNVSGCLRSYGGKLKNQRKIVDLDNFGMD
jgi:hypothetical protein